MASPSSALSPHPIAWTEGDAEVKGRWNDFFQLRQYTGTRLDDLLATLELFLPFSQDSHLAARTVEGSPGPAALIEQWTGGILRDIMILIRDACRRAIEKRRPYWNSASWKQRGKISRRNKSPTSSISSVNEKRGRQCMQTGAFTDRERAIWKRLPLHPQPQPFETLTTTLPTLTQANGLQSLNELGVLAGATWSRVKTHPDYPCPAYEGLTRIAGCPAERLASTTFLHLAQHFGYSPHPNPLRRFLHTSLAPLLRYCPYCLAESSCPYYSLLWRFLTIPGCASHGCLLLEQCGHCG